MSKLVEIAKNVGRFGKYELSIGYHSAKLGELAKSLYERKIKQIKW